jgi:hypothetical protein
MPSPGSLFLGGRGSEGRINAPDAFDRGELKGLHEFWDKKVCKIINEIHSKGITSQRVQKNPV